LRDRWFGYLLKNGPIWIRNFSVSAGDVSCVTCKETKKVIK